MVMVIRGIVLHPNYITSSSNRPGEMDMGML